MERRRCDDSSTVLAGGVHVSSISHMVLDMHKRRFIELETERSEFVIDDDGCSMGLRVLRGGDGRTTAYIQWWESDESFVDIPAAWEIM